MSVLTAGLGATVASGAFTQPAQFDRDASIDVVADSDGIIALEASPASSIVHEDSNGELTIDVTALGTASGLNVGTLYKIGKKGPWDDEPDSDDEWAYKLTNNLDTTVDIDFGFDDDHGISDSELDFKAYDVNGDEQADWGPDTDATDVSVGTGESMWVYIEIDTDGLSPSDDLSGTLEQEVDPQ